MRDIIRMMHFDYITAQSAAIGSPWKILTVLVLLLPICLFLTPIAGYLGMFLTIGFYLPLQSADDKEQLGKMYGILPVHRKSIVRGRFLFMFTVGFLMEIIMILYAWLAIHLRLNTLIPFHNSELMQMAADSFNPDSFLPYGMIVAIFVLVCGGFIYLEMMGQIFGREKEMKVIMITLGVITAVGFGLAVLSDHDMLPAINFDEKLSTTKCIAIATIANVIVFVLGVVFGEITARMTTKREL